MKTAINREQLGLLWAYEYQLYEVGTGEIFTPKLVGNDGIVCNNESGIEAILTKQIGTDFKIIAYPIEWLTKEIEGIGVALNLLGYNNSFGAYNALKKLIERNDIMSNVKDKLYEWHFDLFPEGTTINPDEI